MPRNPLTRLSPDRALANREMLHALNNLPDYAPINPAYNIAELNRLAAEIERSKETTLRLRNAFAAARVEEVAAEWALNEALRGAKAQVVAQYGDEAQIINEIGLKKRSQRRRPVRRSVGPTSS